MKHKSQKQLIRSLNEEHIKPIIKNDDFLRLNVLNYARSEFRNEAMKLRPIGSNPTDFTNIYNMSIAWDYVLKNINSPINMYEIRQINSIIATNNDTDVKGGIFRYSFVNILGQPAPAPENIYNMLDDAIYRMHSDKNQILTKAFDIHYDIITIQPFSDFNKRTARIIMNWYLLQNNYTPILFNHKDDNTEYTNALHSRLNQDNKSYTSYMCNRMIKTQSAIIKMLSKQK